MKIDSDNFRIKSDKKLNIKDLPTQIEPLFESKEDYKLKLEEQIKDLSDLQNLLYGSDTYSILLIFQGMDASGKDGVIKHVFSGINPQGCIVNSFKEPSTEELQHDFLWRTTCKLPERGHIGIFNRSYYEEVLVVKVHPEFLKNQGIPPKKAKGSDFWEDRYQSINDFEEHLERNNVVVLKFFLNLSLKEQKKRLLARIDDPQKNWKFSFSDLKERESWSDYMKAYEDCLAFTSTKIAPWYVIPADDKKDARLIVAHILLEKLKSLNMSYPTLTSEQTKDLEKARAILKE